MSKERLEEIKKHRDEADNSTDEYEFEKINFYNLHVDWLIEQALRVQELEQQNKNYRKAIKECVERMNEGGAGTRSFVYERLIKVLEGEE